MRQVGWALHDGGVAGSDGAALSGGPLWSPGDSARVQALRARQMYPAILWLGPVYGVMEQTAAGWRMDSMRALLPQDARDSLGWWLRVLARRQSTHPAAREECWAASAVLETERLNDIVVAGRRFKVVRADQFCRFSSVAGPEPPRAADARAGADAGISGGTDPQWELLGGGLLGPARTPGGAALPGERWEAVPEGPMVPSEVTRDARAALSTHPGIAMLATRFAAAEDIDGSWPPLGGTQASPGEARRALAAHFGSPIARIISRMSSEDLGACLHAAQRLERDQRNQMTTAGRRFRIIRVETAVRVGLDGPEPPRPSDHDPNPPLAGETAELRTWDLTEI